MNAKYLPWIIIIEFLTVLSIIFISFGYSTIIHNELFGEDVAVVEYREVSGLRCAGINAIGCTTPTGNNHFVVEYVPNSQRCFKPGCVSITDTIVHEDRHVAQYMKYGRMWEWE